MRTLTAAVLFATLAVAGRASAQRPYDVPGTPTAEPRAIGYDKAAYGAAFQVLTTAAPIYYDVSRATGRPLCVGFDSLVHVIAGAAGTTSFAFSLTSSISLGVPLTITPAATAQCAMTDAGWVSGFPGPQSDQGACWTVPPNREAWKTPEFRILTRRVGARLGLCSVGMPVAASIGTFGSGLGPRPFCRVGNDTDCTDAAGSGTCQAICSATQGSIFPSCASGMVTAQVAAAEGCALIMARGTAAEAVTIEVNR